MKIVGVCSPKGGVGKTTTALNLGAALNKFFNKKVVVIDCNFTTSHLGIYVGITSPTFTLLDVLKGHDFERAIYKNIGGVDVVPGSLAIEELTQIDLDEALLKQKIVDELQTYDYVILDSAPGLGREFLITAKTSDEIVFVATPVIADVVDILKAKVILEKLNKEMKGILLNRIRKKRYEIKKEEIQQAIGLEVLGEIPEDKKFWKSLEMKTTVVQAFPNSTISKKYFKAASKILGIYYPEKQSLWGKLVKFFKK